MALTYRFVPPDFFTSALWISEAALAEIPASGDDWDDMVATADSTWLDPVNVANSDSIANTQCMSGALVYARTGTESYRTKVTAYIQTMIDEWIADGYDTTQTAQGYARNLGAFVISADLIDLENHDPTLHSDFVDFIEGALTEPISGGGMSSLLGGALDDRPNNVGNWCRFSTLLITHYIGDITTRDNIIAHIQYFLGDRTVLASDPYDGASGGWGGPLGDKDFSWHADPSGVSPEYTGITPQGFTRDGHDWDGLQPEEMRRDNPYQTGTFNGDGTSTSADLGANAPSFDVTGCRLYFTDDGNVSRVIDTYSAPNATWVTPKGTVPDDGETWTIYPGPTALRYVEESLDGLLGTMIVLNGLGFPAHTWSNDAVGRAATRLKFFADDSPDAGWVYFETTHEGARPLVNYLYDYGYPETRARTQLNGGTKGYSYTFWTHGGRTIA